MQSSHAHRRVQVELMFGQCPSSAAYKWFNARAICKFLASTTQTVMVRSSLMEPYETVEARKNPHQTYILMMQLIGQTEK